MHPESLTLGPIFVGENRCRFRVWAPHADRIELVLLTPGSQVIAMRRAEHGYHEATVENVTPGARYLYRLNGEVERADPASRSQPEGIGKPSMVVDEAFPWNDETWT